jgi:hypothetical protein
MWDFQRRRKILNAKIKNNAINNEIIHVRDDVGDFSTLSKAITFSELTLNNNIE